MEGENAYQPPASDIERPVPARNASRGRRAYVFQLFMIWIALPLLATFLARASGLDEGGVTQTSTLTRNGVNTGYHLDMLYVWYISLPLFVYYTRGRVVDAGLNPWLTIVFLLPLINLAMWFWPPKYP